jgi:hypothetical protein
LVSNDRRSFEVAKLGERVAVVPGRVEHAVEDVLSARVVFTSFLSVAHLREELTVVSFDVAVRAGNVLDSLVVAEFDGVGNADGSERRLEQDVLRKLLNVLADLEDVGTLVITVAEQVLVGLADVLVHVFGLLVLVVSGLRNGLAEIWEVPAEVPSGVEEAVRPVGSASVFAWAVVVASVRVEMTEVSLESPLHIGIIGQFLVVVVLVVVLLVESRLSSVELRWVIRVELRVSSVELRWVKVNSGGWLRCSWRLLSISSL